MDNYIIINKKYIKNLKYEKLISDNLNHALLESVCKKYNLIYAIEEEDNFLYFGTTIDSLNSIIFSNIELKKNYTLFLNIKKMDKYISKLYQNINFENLYIFRSKLYNLNESYKDLYSKLLRNINKKNNLIIYTHKINDIHINYTSYIFDIIYVSNDDFYEFLNCVNNIKLTFNKVVIFNMNYLIFSNDNEDILNAINSEQNNTILLSNNNKKNKNFMIIEYKNLNKINDIKKEYTNNINIIKIIH